MAIKKGWKLFAREVGGKQRLFTDGCGGTLPFYWKTDGSINKAPRVAKEDIALCNNGLLHASYTKDECLKHDSAGYLCTERYVMTRKSDRYVKCMPELWQVEGHGEIIEDSGNFGRSKFGATQMKLVKQVTIPKKYFDPKEFD